MSKSSPRPTIPDVPFGEACDLLESALGGSFRRDFIAALLEVGRDGEALARLRHAMVSHTFNHPAGPGSTPPDLPRGLEEGPLSLRALVRDLDRRTMKEGFQVLKDWDGRAERFRKDIIPVDMLDYFVVAGRGSGSPEPGSPQGAGQAANVPLPRAMATLLDYYFLYVLGLLVLRAWDDGNADVNLDRVTRLLQLLQGEDGSGYRFLESAETLLWIAISNYHPDDHAYDRLLEKVRSLGEGHRFRFAAIGAHILGTHLRWGYEAFYQRDLNLLRRDNFADYPWLLFSLATLMDAYHGLRERGAAPQERREVVLAILNGLTADPPAFTGILPAALADHAEEQARFSDLFHRYRADLVEEFERYRPTDTRYSPIAFHFNFPHNAVKAMVGMALTGWDLPQLPLEALFQEDPASDGSRGSTGTDPKRWERDSPEALARALMEHSRANPEQIGPRRVMVMTYMPRTGLRRFRGTVWGEPDPLAGRAAHGGSGAGAQTGDGRGPEGSPGRTDRLPGSPFQRGATVDEEGKGPDAAPSAAGS